METVGQGSSSFCPKGGSILLVTKAGREVRLKTICKTWRCLGCRRKLKALFRAKVEIGVSSLERCAFITLTYKAAVRPWSAAAYVPKDWRALWVRLRKNEPGISRLKWLRVTELTEKGTPHHHIVAGKIDDSPVACWTLFDIRRYKQGIDSCVCLAHRLSRQWYAVTGDSYIVHAREVLSGPYAGWYMAKYLDKTFLIEDREERLGFARRWSSAVGWPTYGKAQLRQTTEGGWEKRQFRPGKVDEEDLGGPESLLERVGDSRVLAKIAKAKLQRSAIELERMTSR